MAQERPPLEEMTLRQLRRVASRYGISRYSRMRKSQLLSAIQNIQRHQTSNAPLPPETLPETAELTQQDYGYPSTSYSRRELETVDQNLGDLPGGYGESRIVLMPRDPQWAYAYWDVSDEYKEMLRRRGGQELALRLYDVTNVDLEHQYPHNAQEYRCDEIAQDWYLPIPVSGRDYTVEIGYRCGDGRWLVLARSAAVRIPPVHPSGWVEEQFITVAWEEDLRGQTFVNLEEPEQQLMGKAGFDESAYGAIFARALDAEARRVAGSPYWAGQSAHSYVFPARAGAWAVPTVSGLPSRAGLSQSSSASAASPTLTAPFWLVADAELTIYGMTQPGATVSVGGQPVKLNPDGTFCFQMSLQEGTLDYPITAVAADGKQTQSIHMQFTRNSLE